MKFQSASALMGSSIIVILVACLVAVTVVDGEQPPVGTMLCSQQVYTAADSFAADIDRVLKLLPLLDSDVLPSIDVNVYSPDHYHPVAYGQRICADGIGAICQPCFDTAQSSLVSGCRNNDRAGGQITLRKCFMRYEVYNFV